jgi:hypothetical protein
MDMYSWGFPAELCYECVTTGSSSYHDLFCASTINSQHCAYCYFAVNSQKCFGCIGVKKREYCILNKQYSKMEYEQLVPRIVEQMKHSAEWGEFFPVWLSPLPYNTSLAQDYYPLTKEEISAKGWKWFEGENPHSKPAQTVPLPDSIDDVNDSLCEVVLTCRESGRPYKMIRPELEFYRRNRIPVPDCSFPVRHQARLQRRNPRRLWSRRCDKCGKAIDTTFAPQRLEEVLCAECYQHSVHA